MEKTVNELWDEMCTKRKYPSPNDKNNKPINKILEEIERVNMLFWSHYGLGNRVILDEFSKFMYDLIGQHDANVYLDISREDFLYRYEKFTQYINTDNIPDTIIIENLSPGPSLSVLYQFCKILGPKTTYKELLQKMYKKYSNEMNRINISSIEEWRELN
jgi:hypothetical protein